MLCGNLNERMLLEEALIFFIFNYYLVTAEKTIVFNGCLAVWT
jgi:hypothetical protein